MQTLKIFYHLELRSDIFSSLANKKSFEVEEFSQPARITVLITNRNILALACLLFLARGGKGSKKLHK